MIFLTRQGADLDRVWDSLDLPSEFLRDPSSWIEAESVERFLERLDQEFGAQYSKEPLMIAVGHQCFDLRGWGALDSVLKMIQKPQDIYSHPHRFLSYFVSPAPPVANLQREESGVSFDLPILSEEYPLVTEYLRAALEALPKYIGKPLAQVKWVETRLSISWLENQPSFLGEEDLQTNLRPEFIDALVQSLESAQRELEQEKRKCIDLSAELKELKELSKNGLMAPAVAAVPSEDLELIESNVLKMRDYFSRAHQLVTLLVRQNRMDPQVKEAMRRVDWDVVGFQFPNAFSEALGSLRKMRKQNSAPNQASVAAASPKLELQAMDLNEIVDEALGLIQQDSNVKVDRAFFMDRPVKVDRLQLVEALTKVFKKFQENPVTHRGAWTVVTRPKGQRAEIEISRAHRSPSNAEGGEALSFAQDWSEIEKQFKTNKWLMDVSHSPEVGSSFRLQIPLQ